jgi:hypothetical protein
VLLLPKASINASKRNFYLCFCPRIVLLLPTAPNVPAAAWGEGDKPVSVKTPVSAADLRKRPKLARLFKVVPAEIGKLFDCFAWLS